MRLAVVLAQPPLTNGRRTIARVQLAADLLQATEVRTANLFSGAGQSVLDIASDGALAETWHLARVELAAAVRGASDVLLAYGVSEPGGAARQHHRAQVAWLMAAIEESGAHVHLIGGRPRHPSRWQRWTAREYPDLPFRSALQSALFNR